MDQARPDTELLGHQPPADPESRRTHWEAFDASTVVGVALVDPQSKSDGRDLLLEIHHLSMQSILTAT